MNLDLFCKSEIFNNAMLYKDRDYSLSKLKVLNNIFLNDDNGLAWANTKEPPKGGYIISPKYQVDAIKNELVRQNDPDYGTITMYNHFDHLIDDSFFKQRMIRLLLMEPIKRFTGGNISTGYSFLLNIDCENEDNIETLIVEDKNFDPIDFFEITDKSLINNPPSFIQTDWLEGIFFLLDELEKHDKFESKKIRAKYTEIEND